MILVEQRDLPKANQSTCDRALLDLMLDAANGAARRVAPCLDGTALVAAAPATGGAFTAGAYRWIVTCLGVWGESVASNEVTATLADGATQPLYWSPKEDATGYRVYRAVGLTGAYGPMSLAVELSGSTLATSWTDIGAVLSAGEPPATGRISEAKLTLVSAVSRWIKNLTAPAQPDVAPVPAQEGFFLWPSEIKRLQSLCGKSATSAFTVDTAPGSAAGAHRPWCSLAFGALYCSCGSDLTDGEPLYEYGIGIDF